MTENRGFMCVAKHESHHGRSLKFVYDEMSITIRCPEREDFEEIMVGDRYRISLAPINFVAHDVPDMVAALNRKSEEEEEKKAKGWQLSRADADALSNALSDAPAETSDPDPDPPVAVAPAALVASDEDPVVAAAEDTEPTP